MEVVAYLQGTSRSFKAKKGLDFGYNGKHRPYMYSFEEREYVVFRFDNQVNCPIPDALEKVKQLRPSVFEFFGGPPKTDAVRLLTEHAKIQGMFIRFLEAGAWTKEYEEDVISTFHTTGEKMMIYAYRYSDGKTNRVKFMCHEPQFDEAFRVAQLSFITGGMPYEFEFQLPAYSKKTDETIRDVIELAKKDGMPFRFI